ncbi:MAG: ABC transporter ATP-binding protein [Lagierella massiliensis]|nr:ABC transporter ATP-binding protein [Lagierella massiliensis]
MSNLIEIRDLNKKYGKNFALKDLNLSLESGKVIGLLGPNGSGKTTLIKILTGHIKTYKGEVLLNGLKPGKITKSFVSYLPDRNILRNFNKISNCISFYNDFFEDFDTQKALKLLKNLELNENQKIISLSKGMTEKLHLAITLARKSKIYILDEPIAGVDPVARDEILNTIIDNISPESTMIISTHLVKDIENIFEQVIFLKDGGISLFDSTENIRKNEGSSVEEMYKKIFGGLQWENY